MPTLVVEAYGVTIEVAVEAPGLMPRVREILPPGWEPGDPSRVRSRFVIDGDGELRADDELVLSGVDEPALLGALDSAMRSVIAQKAPDRVFIHAGAVARGGRAILLPGATWSGKTTLVAALVRAGAEYLSDEFAVLDSAGRVHPYPKPLSLRPHQSWAQVEIRAGEVGAVGSGPAEVAVIASTRYAAVEAALGPGSAGEAAIALFEHAVAARARSAAVLEAVRAAATDAVYLEGPRGEAEPTARALLACLDESQECEASALDGAG
jgi:hypothetical protein